MEKSSATAINELLSEFQKFPRDNKLVPEKNVFLFALWVSKFFNYARKKQIYTESYQENIVSEFLEALKSDPPSFRMADQTGTMTRSSYTIFTIGASNPAICGLSLLAGAPKSPLVSLFSLGKTGAASGGKDKPA